jgi:methyltransferase (TIGR00027 family)
MSERRGVSRTAEFVALFRALESRLPPAARLFEDPYASAFLGRPLSAVLSLARVPVTGALVPASIDRGWPGTRVSVVVRTRFIDEAVEAAVAGGIAQLVIMGAGFDARALRLDAARRVRVFELDEPATLATKRDRLERALGALPNELSQVAIDFEREPLSEPLRAAGFATAERALFVWEGVTSYLTAAAVDATLRAVAAVSAAGSRLVFTYIDRRALEQDRVGAAARTVRRVGEPFTFGFDPAELPAYLAERELELLDDVSARDLAERYLRPRGRRPPASPAFRIAVTSRR